MDVKKKKLLKNAFDNYIALMLYDFPLEKAREIVADEVTGYGTTVDEKILEIKRLLKGVADQREQGAGLTMEIKSMPVHRRISPDEDTALFMDEFEISMIFDETKNVIPLRLTSVFECIDNTWKLVHLHGSKAVETEGDTWHVNEWKKKNEELQKLVDEKTADLASKNRELEIEAALERVRAVALSMQKPDDLLNVCRNISEQLESLNVKNIRNVQVAIIDELKKNYANYQYFTAYRKTVFEKTGYENNAAAKGMVTEMQKSANSFFIGSIQGEELKKFKAWRNNDEQFPDPLLDKSDAAYYYFYSIGNGGLGLTTYKEISNESLELFKRFYKVFTLAYRRFKDIQQAQEQAREAQIEAALERVRARAMAMHKADELVEVTLLLRKEMGQLGVEELETSSIYIHNESKGKTECWFSIQDQKDVNNLISDHMILDLNDTWVGKKMQKFYRSGNPATSIVMKGENRIEWISYCAEKSDLFSAEGFYGKTIPERTYHLYKFKNGYMGAAAPGDISTESWDLLKRATAVFSLAYTRFSDLKKAEAQARESRIQLALERVRARTMAMHNSQELADAAAVVFDQLTALGIDHFASGLSIIDKETQSAQMWLSYQGNMVPEPLTVDFNATPVLTRVYKAWLKGEPFYSNLTSGEQYNQHIQFLKKIFGEPVEQFLESTKKKLAKSGMEMPGQMVMHHTFFSKGSLILNNITPIKEQEILNRFAKVFEQTYTRFLDLQRAEAQARESEIQLALERVRARTMAMQKSDELAETMHLLSEQLKDLGEEIDQITIGIFDEEKGIIETSASIMGNQIKTMPVPLNEPFVMGKFYQEWKRNEKSLIVEIRDEELQKYNKWRNKFLGKKIYPTDQKDGKWIVNAATFSKGLLSFSNEKQASSETLQLLERFAAVFDLTYTRFLDLKNAEAQAREAKIETALEKVRSRSMGMQKSDELNEVIHVIYDQFVNLGIKVDHTGFIVDYKNRDDMLIWLADQNGPLTKIAIPYFDSPHWNSFVEAKKKGKDFFINQLDFETKNRFYKKLFKFIPELPEESKKFYLECPGLAISTVLLDNVGLYIENFSGTPYSDEENKILMRFGKVFQQSYTRFLDLEKAEAQTREAQIEASLEKVRGVALSLQKSDQMLQIAQVLYEQLLELGFNNIRNAIIDIKNGNTDNFTDYDYSHEMSGTVTQMSYHDDPTLTGQFKKMATTTNDFFELILEGKELEDLKKMRIKNGEAPDPRLDKIDVLTYNLYSFGNGAIGISNFGVLTEEEKSVLARFSNVFTFAYKRYKDMLQAEKQAREALVELSLERIRAQVTAMRESSELLDIVVTMQTEFNKLGHEAHYFWHMRWLPDKYEKALTNAEGDRIGNVLELPRGFHGLKNMMDWELSDEASGVFALDPDTAADYIDKMIRLGRFQEIDHTAPGPDEVRDMGGLTFVMARTTHGEIGYTLPGEVPNPPKDDVALLVRFAGVFDLAYRRFEDLKSAERQNRETQIDLALERVRAKTMAMQKSEELSEVVANLFYQLDELGIKPYRCNLGIINAKTKYCQLWSTTSDGKVIPLAPNIPLTENKHLKKIFSGWKKQSAPFVDIIQGKNRLEWTQYIRKFSDFEEYKPEKLNKKKILSEPAILNQVFFKQGFFTIHTVEEMKDEYFDIIQRFARVFEQTYTRFLDLQRAEVQASEAVKQASLDRIRGQIASMRTTEDLKQLTPLVWRELKTLEVPFFRCGLFIVDEKKKHVNVYLTTPDGKPLGVLDLDFKANDLARATVASWKKKEVYQTHWNREEFIAWTKEMMQLGQVKVPEKYQGAEEPPESLHLHFIPFAQGMLYVGHEEQLEKEKIDLVKSLAEAFSFAYARYEDFVVLEEAKERVEKALSDLKATQSQLVHAEKMASLGELTAGIAHEIQNPLNFVNNFSEVSTDLIEELKEELQNGDTEEVKAIATDLLQNLEKINHHGKRASNIVKSMLEHSRAGSAEKQPTDLNALADEYLRLAYHGLRAKDKSFNADFKLEADKSLPKVNIVAQEIGRVLLNLINNGFYAVSDKAKQSGADYKPELIVTTKNTGGKVEISVKDNGKGIPDKVKEKIFQPFFTTKPTGEGTGLGLSMSYDIITKGHGGKLKVDSIEDKGSTFIVQIPIND